MNADEKLERARCRLMLAVPFYGHAAMQMRWKASEMPWLSAKQRTMGVRIVEDGIVDCLYYPPFVEALSVDEVAAVIQHEIEHVVRLHCIRQIGLDREVFNIAADMCVNGPMSCPRIGIAQDSSHQRAIPFRNEIVWIPQSWESYHTAEHYYDRLIAEHRMPDTRGLYGTMLDDHMVWDQSTCDFEEARCAVRTLVAESATRNQGQIPAHLTEAVARLEQPAVSWVSQLRRYVGRHLGGRRTTLARTSRRRQEFGVPGISRRAGATINVVTDTSGSVSPRLLDQFFGEIDAISSRAKVHVLQWDQAFQGYEKYKRNDWKKFKIKGRGGTDMAAPFDWLIENGEIADVQILLTDGYCNWPTPRRFPLITVIAGAGWAESKPSWGTVIHIDSA
jgi:predicted metal-dependent peptidase